MSEPVEEVFYPTALHEEDEEATEAVATIKLLAEGVKGNKVLLEEARNELCAARQCLRSRSVWRDFVRKHFSF